MEPLGHLDRIADGERVDDAVAGQAGNLLGQPRETLRLSRQSHRLEHERGTVEIALHYLQVGPQHGSEILHHSIVCGRGRSKQPETCGKRAGNPLDQAVMRPEVVPPIRDAVRFVDDEEGDAVGDIRQHLGAKVLVSQPFGSDDQDVYLVLPQACFRNRPVFLVVRRDSAGAHPHSFGSGDLVAHQCQQRRNQERRPGLGLAQQLRRDEVDEALSPSGLLDDQESTTPFHDVANGGFLSLTELGIGLPRAQPQQLQGAPSVVFHNLPAPNGLPAPPATAGSSPYPPSRRSAG